MIITHFLEACLIGVAIAAPVGPIGMLCINRVLQHGFKGAVVVGLGAALADSVYGMVAALGLTAISNMMISNAFILKLFGGLFLLYLAYQEANSGSTSKPAKISSKSDLMVMVDVFCLTITNPMTILSFIAIFASIGVSTSSPFESIAMVLGIFTGSMGWSCFLGAIVSKIRHKLSITWTERIKRFSIIILIIFGFYAVTTAFLAL